MRKFDGSQHINLVRAIISLALLLQLQLIVFRHKHRQVQDLFAGRSFLWIDLKHSFQYCVEISRIMRWNLRVYSLKNSVVQSLHVFGGKGRVQSYKLVENAAQGPDVWLVVVWFVLPHLRTSIVRRPSLGLENTWFGNFRNIKISQLDHAVLGQEDVGTFNISMYNLPTMQAHQPEHHLVEYRPYVIFLGKLGRFLSIINFSLQIAVIAVFHHDAQAVGMLLKEGLFITCDVWVFDRGQDSYFIQSIFFLFCGKFHHFDLFKCVSLRIRFPYNLENFRKRAWTKLIYNLKIQHSVVGKWSHFYLFFYS